MDMLSAYSTQHGTPSSQNRSGVKRSSRSRDTYAASSDDWLALFPQVDGADEERHDSADECRSGSGGNSREDDALGLGDEIKGVPENQAEIVVCEGNFHGRTTTVISFSSEASYKRGFGPLTPGFKTVPYGDIDD